MRHFRSLLVLLLLLVSLLLASPAAFSSPSFALGWVGNMYPRPGNGSPATISEGTSFDVYLQVYKAGITEPSGQGATITCTLHWSEVNSFGGSWLNPTNTTMSYHTDIGNNDEYKATISPGEGLYEFTANCTDTTDNSTTWQGDGNGQLTVNPAPGSINQTRALWVDEQTIAWNGTAGTSYKLLYDADGGLDLATSSFLTLTPNGTISGYAKFPNATGWTALEIGSADLASIPSLLKGQVAVASYDGSNTLLDATGVQIQGVLDDLYAVNAVNETLGVTYSGNLPTLKLWAPTAKSVILHRFADANPATIAVTSAMTWDANRGIWSMTGDSSWDKHYYLYEIEVYAPETDQVETYLVTDPYAVNLSQNSQRSQIVDLYNDATLKPTGWESLTKPDIAAPEDITIIEVHVRDFSINDTTVTNAAHRGTFKAFTYDGVGPHANTTLSNGMNHLLDLQAAGLTHVHLLPVFDIASVNEDPASRSEPDPALLATYARDSDQQQEAISDTRHLDAFNWGYDPFHYGAPEGSYATAQDDTTRIVEFREMVQALNQNGLRVVMDVVYNHTHASGQSGTSVLDKVVPGYYHRYDNNGVLQTTSCCSDTASEFDMMQKLMIDTVLQWAKAYKVDGFRFDLMNLHTVANATAVTNAVQALTEGSDGVDGSQIYVYGEGWDFGSAKNKGLTHANQYHMAGTGIGTFNDKIRDAAHGGFNTDSLQIRHQGFINGLSYDWNGYLYNNRAQGDLRYETDRLRVALAGSLQSFSFIDQNDSPTTGAGLNGTGYTLDPQESINYVSKHDNETLYDLNIFKAPLGEGGTAVTSMADRVRMQNMGLSLVGLAQGIPFFHLGSDMLRSKSLDRNSYDSGDWFNRLDFTYNDNNFGVGLPPAWDNQSRWAIMQPLLADTSLSPATADIQNSVEHLKELLQIRQSSPLFRLQTATDINNRLHFHNTGSTQTDGLIVMTLSDVPSPDLDATSEYIVVLFNAHKISQSFTLGTLAGLNFSLHPVQQASHDATVQTATFNSTTGEFTIPARTTAVFVSTQAPSLPSGIDWVGNMYPAGDSSSQVAEGDSSGQAVYVQVYEPGVTGSNNGSTGATIDCYLHWGEAGSSWTDIEMTFNAAFSGNASNDEYYATIPTAALTAGTYGFTAYCTDDGGTSKKWRDGGDGILTITPASTPPPGNVFVHLFEWKWTDIEKECTFLAEKGYHAIQVSPPMEHVVPAAANSYAWWVRYQPVSYSLANSRSGTLAEFQSMLTTCQNLGVEIYVDAVINHTTGVGSGTGTNGSTYTDYDYPAYDPADFHYCGTAGDEITDYNSRFEVQNCELLNLADLDTSQTDVRTTIRAYLQSLVDMGVAGFRLDASKHIASSDIEAILDGLTGAPYIFQEVIDLGGEPVQSFEYLPNGDVTEFKYPQAIANAFTDNSGAGCPGPDLSGLSSLGSQLLASDDAVIFTDNHDNQRGHGAGGACVVDHLDGDAVYNLANIFMLAHPYGYPKVMSSYYWDGSNDDAGPPSTSGAAGSGANTINVYGAGQVAGDTPTRCADGTNWVCEHRRIAIANMVEFRLVTNGEAVTDWWDNSPTNNNQIAFGRADKGFVAINRDSSNSLTHTFSTSMAAGIYCDVTKGELSADGTSCTGATITVDGSGNIVNQTINAMDGFAIHIAAQLNTDYGDAPSSYGIVWHTQGSARLGDVWRTDDGITLTRLSATSSRVDATVNGADGYLTGWIDWNEDGDFEDAGEQLFANEFIMAGQTRSITFSTPTINANQTLIARFRLYETEQTALRSLQAAPSPTGGATGGEAEDYSWLFIPLAVELATFSAITSDEQILITWQTVSEDDNLGFNLYRHECSPPSIPPNSGREECLPPSEPPTSPLNATLIPAQAPGSGQGATYEWTDGQTEIGTTYYYWLEDVDLHGVKSLHGPISAIMEVPTSIIQQNLNIAPIGSGQKMLLLLLGVALLAGIVRMMR